ncbi:MULTISPECIES: 8-oxo-dGTP diphosphatase [unclassified Oceanispirochaeta]|uniref:8-oxo-dGTP diphosphatase n=1 Tax=unclassified Oceanispirochaeta TaxID=2635722 RepID=UPI000E099A5B|nr:MULTISPECIES: 8-oxo-dGTP diphosphatase [unclassified Oceanispirochaeta]MBF9017680.1 8-oxo-dGTP diphosphatase [Oceanispirochaeta sp. M2]NPD74252.1 8-oxo-dGTP diphosphatase [Oceanispirochaeta sp. M1]RDG29958.1 8-oxo-dGTP diphosphatase [Oceanispirochaeta sp. M1]
MKVSDVDWKNWVPTEDAVITYILKGNEVLLIHKKTGLGAGKVNAPGGHIEEGEAPLEAAVRETIEEVGLITSNLQYSGELFFHFLDGLQLKGTVYLCSDFKGEMIETDEALPFWCPLEEIPWDRMWEDDIHWLPRALKGEKFSGRFVFEKEKMLDSEIAFD